MDLTSLQASLPHALVLLVLAYLLGSISSAILVCRVLGYPDPRTEGSLNPGATNVLRIAGKPAAAMTLLGDVLKGVIPVAIGRWIQLPEIALALVGFGAFLGHLLPLFFSFRGGKGVATAFGVLFTLYWPLGLITGATWLVVFGLFRISSLGSIIAFIIMPLAALWLLPDAVLPLGLLSLTLLARHHINIRKLVRGEELGFRGKSDDRSS